MKKPFVVTVLGTAQTLAWASSYYIAALLAAPMARDMGLREPTVFLAFSLALVVSAFVGPWAGRTIDRHGGRQLLMGTNLLFAAGLAGLGLAQGPWTLFAGWLVLGLAMGTGLYEAAFATLVRLYGHDSRNAITGITLFGGFASTVGWPLTAWMETAYGWRGACFGWAALHLVLGLPLNAALPKVRAAIAAAPAPAQPVATQDDIQPQHPMLVSVVLSFVFAVAWFTSTAMAAHLPRLMQALGASLAVAVAVGALVGPAQVAGRLLEFGVLRRVHPLLSTRLANLAHPIGAVALLFTGPALAPVFAVLHGAGNGILTIAKGTLPLVFFGPQGYGARQGWLMLPGRVAQAFAPFAFGLALDHWGAASLWLSTALGLVAFIALMTLRADRR
ncbi:MFS transporter [Piscinibacter gummiphilus]|uniref:MFS transporter n=1 Tax=Piscinibacter gummiphilus TaxID=946333 RepID=A0ABZ0D495_9BURK|nr:MFS transporter [Piscinibacter gummiphilus]WOB10125.1 MFS transporter [Piscinibacter gummiphilus]